LTEALDADETVAGVGSKLLYPDGTIQHAGVSIIDNRTSNDRLCGEHIWKGRPAEQPEANQVYHYQALTAACLLVRRDAFEAVQGLDEGYWNGCEDIDLCFKLGQKGWKLIYQPASVVIHHDSKSGSERFARVDNNIQRLHDKWFRKIRPDIIINTNSIAEEGVGISSGSMGPYVPGAKMEK
jgi:GT2 family glycosyltransferase